MRPSAASSILLAAGTFGRPGIVMMSPQITTTNSAPAESLDLADRNDMPRGRALGIRIGAETVLGLRHADREIAKAFLLQLGEAVAHALVGADVFGAVDLARDGARLLPERHIVGIERFELARLLIDGTHHGLGQLNRAGAALRPMVGHDAFDAELGAELLEQRDLALGVAREAVDRDDHRHAVFLQILDVALQIGKALL